MKPGDRLICALPEPLAIGMIFKSWPLHVTIVPWFRLGLGSEQVVADLQEVWRGVQSFIVRMGEESVQFGHQQGKLATLVRLPSSLIEIERLARDYLHSKDAWLVDESTRARHEFRPHVTAQPDISLHTDDEFWCDRLYILEQGGDHKVVAAEVGLQT